MNFTNYDSIHSSINIAPMASNHIDSPEEQPIVIEPVKVSICDVVNALLEAGGEISVPCTVEEFNEAFVKFKPARRACKLNLSWTDGVLNASARL